MKIEEIKRAIERLNNDMTKMSDMYEKNLRIKDDLCIAIDCMETELERAENTPLTIEELKEMRNLPVWVDCEESHWIIIERVNSNDDFTVVRSTNGIDYVDVEMKFSYMCQFDGNDNCTFYKHKPKED